MNIEFRAKKSPLKLESFWQEDRNTSLFVILLVKIHTKYEVMKK